MTYKASLDNLAKIASISITLLFVFILYFQYPILQHESYWLTVFISGLLVLTYALSLGYSPRSYQISGDYLTINRLFYDAKYERRKIEKVEVLNKEQMGFAIRTFGVGGLFGYFGYYASKNQGSMLWYATQREKFVMIHLEGNKKIVLTPDDAISFVSELTR
ncbi:PH domain-containing protein [Flectobacillus longus]|uniref:PH domain-containing protein n=1 Tax=Flectobacillus longus TaxID=2984207 RepID=UPI0024B65B11|nr:PH domain-containing protein [Flectobacillus longus]MDI9877909.1 PH domain-containing protein [Flectobacillus longus]